MEHAGKVAVVTGASRGLGKAIALELARGGASVALTARNQDDLEAVAAAALEAGAPKALVFGADLRTPSEPARIVDEVVTALGGLNYLVNNAGDTKRGDFLDLSDDDHLSGFELKYHATVRFCRAAWPHLTAAEGSIVNISGIGAHTPDADFTIGGPVNSAIINFSKALAKRALTEGPRVNTLCPGHIVTDRLHGRIQTLAEAEGLSFEDAKERMRIGHGIRRYGDAGDIAAMVSFLCSERAAYVHGATVDVDGGATPGI